MKRDLVVAVRMTLVTLVLTGVLYPLLVTGLAQTVFPRRSHGSLVAQRGRVLGSELIGQRFTNPAYFQGRASAAGADGYDATASGGSNLGPLSRRLRERMGADLARLLSSNPGATGPVPEELLSASASGLDPHLSPRAALWQAPRIAAARGLARAAVESLVVAAIEPRTLGFLGEPRVNVLRLNLALDREFGRQPLPPGGTGGGRGTVLP